MNSSILRPPPLTSQSQSQSQVLSLHQTPLSQTSASSNQSSDPQYTLETLNRQSTHIQKTLQSLLDAQSAALRRYTSGTSTDSAAQPRSQATRRQATPRPLSLRDARRGLAKAMGQLIRVRDEEAQVHTLAAQSAGHTLSKIEDWESRRRDLQSELSSIRNGYSDDTPRDSNLNPGTYHDENGDGDTTATWQRDPQSPESQAPTQTRQTDLSHLKHQQSAIARQIHDLESKLLTLRDEQGAISAKIRRLENAQQAREASYVESLRLIDQEVGSFLARSPPGFNQKSTGLFDQMARSVTREQQEGIIWDLPVKRRTLQMAVEWYERERETRDADVEAAAQEIEALRTGEEIWTQVVDRVQSFERALAGEMRRMGSSFMASQSLIAHENGEDALHGDEGKEGARAVLRELDETLSFARERLRDAEERGWNLLVCCIGAELEALQQGREILRDVAGLDEGDTGDQTPQSEGGSGDEGSKRSAVPGASSSSGAGLVDRGVRAESDNAEERPFVETIESGSEGHSPAIERGFDLNHGGGQMKRRTSDHDDPESLILTRQESEE